MNLLILCDDIELVKLSLASNNIQSLPDEIGECRSLKELYLNNNAKLSSMPSSTGHLRFVSPDNHHDAVLDSDYDAYDCDYHDAS